MGDPALWFGGSTSRWVLQRPPRVPWLMTLQPAGQGEEGSRPLQGAMTGTGQEERALVEVVPVSYSSLRVLGWGQSGEKVSVLQRFDFCRP